MSDRHSLCLHVGHGKTGSSYLQSAFAHSVTSLAEAGVDYPVDWKLRRSARGGISSGNAAGVIHFLDRAAKAEARLPALQDGFRKVLVSSENMFPRFAKRATVQHLVAGARAAGFDDVRVLVFIRDPVSHCASAFQQAVKRGGYTGTIDAKVDRFNYPERVEACLDACEGIEGFELTVRNYSRARGGLLPVVAAWLGVPETALTAPPMDIVNRSLSRGELEFQRVLNGVLGESGDVLADALCELLPTVKAEHIRPSLAAQERLWKRLEPTIARINARIDEGDRYSRDIDTTEPVEQTVFTFSAEQIRVIAQSLGAEIARLRGRAEGREDMVEAAVAAQGDMPENRKLLYDIARRHFKADEMEAAEKALRQLIAMAPDHAGAHLTLAKVLTRTGRLEAALPVAEHALTLSPGVESFTRMLSTVKRRLAAA